MCMKRIVVCAAVLGLLFGFLPAEENTAVRLDFYGGAACKESWRDEEGGGETEREVKADSGVALCLQDVKLILAGGLPYTAPAELGEDPASCWTDRGVKRGGISVRLADDRLRFVPTVLYGTLHFAASLSRFKQPCRSVPWNYGSLSLPAPGLAAALPGFSSAERPPALALVLEPAAAGLPLPVLEIAAVEGGEMYAGMHTELPVPLSHSSCISLAVNGGSFVYGGKEVKSWFYKEPFYRERRYLSADAELSFRLERVMSAHFAAGFSENPFEALADAFFWERGQLAFSFRHWGLTASHFTAEEPEMILPGGSRLNRKSRLSLNPSVRFPLGPGLLSLALLGMRDEKLKGGDEEDCFTHGLKGCWNCRRLKLSCQYTDSFHERDEEGEAEHVRKLGLGFSYRGRALRTASSFNMKREEAKNAGTLSFTQSFYPARGALSRFSLGFSSAYGDEGLTKLGLRAGMAFVFRARHTSFQGKLLYTSTFYGNF